MYTVIYEALRIASGSDSALDITVGSLVNLWGFGPIKSTNSIPDSSEVSLMHSICGIEKIKLMENPFGIKKSVSELYIDLSSIAKGYGVDQVGEYLNMQNIKNYMVEIGGEVRTCGKNSENKAWTIGISTPDGTANIEKVINISNKSIATSGDYRTYFEQNDKRY